MDPGQTAITMADVKEYESHVEKRLGARYKAVIYLAILMMALGITFLLLVPTLEGLTAMAVSMFFVSAGLVAYTLSVSHWLANFIGFNRQVWLNNPQLESDLKAMADETSEACAQMIKVGFWYGLLQYTMAGCFVMEDPTQWIIALILIVAHLSYMIISFGLKRRADALGDDMAQTKVRNYLTGVYMEKPKQHRLRLTDDGEVEITSELDEVEARRLN